MKGKLICFAASLVSLLQENNGNWATAYPITNCSSFCECRWEDQEDGSSDGASLLMECSDGRSATLDIDIPSDVQVLKLDENELENFNAIVEKISRLPNVREIDVSRNRLSSLASNFTSDSITNLKANGNRLTILNSEPFESFPKLKQLSLSRNSITNVDKNLCWKDIEFFQSLDVSYNKIDHLDWIKNCSSLTTIASLNISGNKLEHTFIKGYTFFSLKNLTSLQMAEMNIHELNVNAFSGVELLEEVNLNNNRLLTIPTTAIAKLTNLKTLFLNGNSIRKIGTGAFQGLLRLEVIELTKLPLLLIDQESFQDLPELTTLLLSDNSMLSYIDKRAFIRCHKVAILDVHNAMIETIQKETIDSLLSLRNVKLMPNPINCNCMMNWARNWSMKNEDDYQGGRGSIVCTNPSQYRGSQLNDVPQNEGECKSAPEIQPTFPLRLTVENNKLTINCRAFGKPQPTIDWLLPNGEKSSDLSQQKSQNISNNEGTLILRDPRPGPYMCIATNEKGNAYRKTQVILREVKKKETTDTVYSKTIKPDYQLASKQSTIMDGKAAISITRSSFQDVQAQTKPYARSKSTDILHSERSNAFKLTVPHIHLLEITPSSALFTLSENNLLESFQQHKIEKITIILKYQDRITYTNSKTSFWLVPKKELSHIEYNISSLHPGRQYKVCLIVQCCQPKQTAQSCKDIQTTTSEEDSTSSTVLIISMLLCFMFVVLGLAMFVYYGRNCQNPTISKSFYEKIDNEETKFININQPLIDKLPWKKENHDHLIKTTTTSYI